MLEFIFEGLLNALGALVRVFLISLLPGLLHWSPARLFRIGILGHDPADSGTGIGMRLLWGAVDLASWILLIAIIALLAQPGAETVPPEYEG